MSHSKIKKLLFLMMFVFAASLYCEEAIDVSYKLNKITDDYLIFDVTIKNNSETKLYFYPKGAKGFLKAVDDTFLVIPNNDANYRENGIVAAHEPYWNESECIELKPNKKFKYKYKIRIHYKSKIPKNNLSKEDVLAVPKLAFSICVIDKHISEIKSFDEYIQCMKTNILAGKWFILYDKTTDGKK